MNERQSIYKFECRILCNTENEEKLNFANGNGINQGGKLAGER